MKSLARVLAAQFVAVSLVVAASRYWTTTWPAKEAVFIGSTGLVLSLFLWRRFARGAHEVTLWPVDGALALFILWSFVSVAIAQNRWAAVEPLLTILSLAALFILARSISATRRDISWIFGAIALSVALVAAFGASQYLVYRHFTASGISPAKCPPIFFAFVGGRIQSTMGNPDVLAAFLNFGIFATLGLLLSGVSRRMRAALAAVVLLAGAALYLAQSRGSIFAMAGGLVVLLFLHWRWSPSRRRIPLKVLVPIVLLFAAVGAAIFVVRGGGRLQFFSDPIRPFLWKNSVRLIKARPVTGHGLGQFSIRFPEYAGAFVQTSEDSVLYAEHAHSEPLEMASEMGLVGLALALAGFGLLVHTVSTIRPPGGEDAKAGGPGAGPGTGPGGAAAAEAAGRLMPVAGALAGMTAILVQSLVSVETRYVQTSFPLFLAAGLALAVAGDYGRGAVRRTVRVTTARSRNLRFALVAVSVPALVLFSIGAARAISGQAHQQQGEGLMMGARSRPNLAPDLNMQAVEEYSLAVEANPYAFKAWYGLGAVRDELGENEAALEAFKRVEALMPNIPRVHRMLGAAYEKLGEADLARQEYAKDEALGKVAPPGR